MKAILRSGPVASLLGMLIWAWMALIARTVRWRVEGKAAARTALESGEGVIVAAWHEQILLLPSGWIRMMRGWVRPGTPAAMLISLSPDGEPVAQAVRRLGLRSIRGSRRNRKKRDKDKGGARAIGEAVRLLKSGGALCITPDGPRGPAREVGLGPVLLAKRSGARVVPYALAVSHAVRLKTWDRFIIPFPFARGAIVFGEPIQPDSFSGAHQVGSELQRRLDAAGERASALLREDGRETPYRDAA